MIMFHLLTEGRAFVRLHDGRREELQAGDIVVLPHGDAHFFGNGSPEKPVDSLATFGDSVSEGLKPVRFGGGGEITRFICGYLACEPQLSEVILAGLPRILKVHIANDPSGSWLEHGIRFSVEGSATAPAGTAAVIARLSELLFVETLRRYINLMPADQIGWLAGARDPAIGKALAILHKEPAEAWTISGLARRIGLSRTRFAERFRYFLGQSPMSYLALWRLKLGAEILRTTEDTVAEIAAAVGYGSESAFNRAFKRQFRCPPAQFRRRNAAALANHP